MLNDEFKEGLAEILEIDASAVGPDVALTADNWDSLAIVSTIALVDDTHGVMLNGLSLAKCQSVQDLLALIEKARTSK
jgi:acyl carrier protein